jgi:hypothetical protein
VQWLWFSVALFFSYGDSFGSFLENRKIRFVPHVIVYYLRYHTWVSFSMYAMLFVVSVLSLKRGTRCNRLYCPPLLLVRVLTAAMRLQCAQATTSIRWVRWQLIGEIPSASCSHTFIDCLRRAIHVDHRHAGHDRVPDEVHPHQHLHRCVAPTHPV